MKRFACIAIIAVAVVIGGCVKNEESMVKNSGNNTMVFKASIESTDTRTTLDESDAVGALVKWEYDTQKLNYDIVGVYMKQAFDNRLTEIEENSELIGYSVSAELFVVKPEYAGQTTAQFESEISDYITPLETDDYYAVYPHSMISTHKWERSQSVMELNLAQNQVSDFQQNFRDNGAMVAKQENASYKNLFFAFKNLHSIIKLTLTGDEMLDKIVFRGNNDEVVAGTFTIDFASDDITKTQFSDDGAKEITLSCGVQLTSDPKTFYIIVPAREYEKGYTVEFIAQDGETLSKSVGGNGPKTLQRSTVYTLPVVDFSDTSTGEDAEADWLWQTSDDLISNVTLTEIDGAVDLGDAANCYMVNAAGVYKFKIAKGNGDSVSDVLKDKYIYFKASEGRGNAVIGLKINDRIVWSWHIWMTDTTGVGDAAAGHVVMDRNLGATSTEIGNVGSCGLYYQWGRKDPFLGANSAGVFVKGDSETTAFGDKSATYLDNGTKFQTIDNNDTTITDCLDYAVANPMTFIKYTQQVDGKSGNSTWFNSDYNNYTDLWGGESGNKSAYDPCPAGYRVPVNADQTWSGYDKTSFTFTELGATDNGSGITYPLAGYRNTKGCLVYLGAYVFVSSATMTTAAKGTGLYMVYYKLSSTAKNPTNIITINPAACFISQGCQVRCEKME